jgi:phospholipid/cholesterol/gamma-HCH transport system substrate-binding protein
MVNEDMRVRRLQWRVGIFVLIALAVFLGTIYALGARARLFEARYTIYADFTEVAGLVEGATVRLAGVQIGRVTGVYLPSEPGGKVRVELTVARRFADRVRKNSVARIETQGLLGDKLIEVTVGTADAPSLKPGEVLATRDPFELGQAISESAQTIKSVAALTESLRETADALNQSKLIEDAAATVRSARQVTGQFGRIADQIEKGRGWAHVLLYEEPVALRRLNDTLVSTNAILDRIERGDSAVGVLTSAQSAEAARRFVGFLERLGRVGDRPHEEDGLLAALLFDPGQKAILDEFRGVLGEFRVTARNLRQVSERVLGGRGTLGSLVKDEPGDPGLKAAITDLRVAVANLRTISEKANAITDKIQDGEGTLGALIADPTVYERLVTILEGAQKSSLFRIFLRGLAPGSRDAAGNGK